VAGTVARRGGSGGGGGEEGRGGEEEEREEEGLRRGSGGCSGPRAWRGRGAGGGATRGWGTGEAAMDFGLELDSISGPYCMQPSMQMKKIGAQFACWAGVALRALSHLFLS